MAPPSTLLRTAPDAAVRPLKYTPAVRLNVPPLRTVMSLKLAPAVALMYPPAPMVAFDTTTAALSTVRFFA